MDSPRTSMTRILQLVPSNEVPPQAPAQDEPVGEDSRIDLQDTDNDSMERDSEDDTREQSLIISRTALHRSTITAQASSGAYLQTSLLIAWTSSSD